MKSSILPQMTTGFSNYKVILTNSGKVEEVSSRSTSLRYSDTEIYFQKIALETIIGINSKSLKPLNAFKSPIGLTPAEVILILTLSLILLIAQGSNVFKLPPWKYPDIWSLNTKLFHFRQSLKLVQG